MTKLELVKQMLDEIEREGQTCAFVVKFSEGGIIRAEKNLVLLT